MLIENTSIYLSVYMYQSVYTPATHCKISCQKILPDKNLYCKPCIADALYEEECIMSIGAVLVKGPGSQVPARPEGDVPDHRDPHVRVGFEAER
jgi:hypothetical protein